MLINLNDKIIVNPSKIIYINMNRNGSGKIINLEIITEEGHHIIFTYPDSDSVYNKLVSENIIKE
jgi:hypothetical protein